MKLDSGALAWGKRLFLMLFAIFCVAYPIAVTGVAFDVQPPFSLAWAGSALLFLEGSVLIMSACVQYGWSRGLLAGMFVIVLSYVVEAIGVGTGFPFGMYRYTTVLLPRLPGSVPLAVMFAWVLIVFGVYGSVGQHRRPLSIDNILIGAVLATLLDLEIEPVAAHLEHYWEWLAPGRINYYGVPLMNFVAWFVVAFVLLFIIDKMLVRDKAHGFVSRYTLHSSYSSRHSVHYYVEWLISSAPTILFCASLFMFGLVDITHGYYWAALPGLLAALLLLCTHSILLWKREKIYA